MAEERGVWGNQVEFILTLVGYAVGLGNVWRFPFLCYQNGGGAFLIPYIVSLLLLGIPIFALECTFGQFGGKGPLTIWSINPLFKGLGIAMILVSTIIFIYYDIIIAQALRFLVASFTTELPWVECKSCECLLYGPHFFNSSEIENLRTNNSLGITCEIADLEKKRSPSEIFYYDDILADSGSISEIGEIRWELLVCNLVGFLIIFLVLVKGIASLGKVVYFTATFPYILLTIFLVKAATLEGAMDGVKFYLTPDWERLKDGKVWSDAATQIFFSLSACLGGLIAMSSYNRFNNNIVRDAFVVPVINCLTSFYAGFVVFCTLGNMAHDKGVPISNVTSGGPGLVFVVYPESIGTMPVPTLWAVLFFFMLCILGFSTQFSAAETIMTSLIDEFPNFFASKSKKLLMRLGVCLAAFVLGIPMTTQGGQHLLTLVDEAVLGFPLLIIGLFEIIVIIYIYGLNRFGDDMKSMLGYSPFLYFKIMWVAVTPFLLVVLVVFKAYETKPMEYAWVDLLYYLIVVFVLMWIPIAFLFFGREEIGKAMAPGNEWLDRKKLAAGNGNAMQTDASLENGNSHKQNAEMGMVENNTFDNKGFETDNDVSRTRI